MTFTLLLPSTYWEGALVMVSYLCCFSEVSKVPILRPSNKVPEQQQFEWYDIPLVYQARRPGLTLGNKARKPEVWITSFHETSLGGGAQH